MNVLLIHVHDIYRFKHYMKLKFNMHAGITMACDINKGYHVRLNDIPECDVSYFKYMHICDLKIINNEPRKFKKKIMPTDITDNKPQEQSSLELYNVSYTKVINYCESLNKHQIDALLKDPNVKSINIKK